MLPKPRPKAAWGRFMKWARRIHLYSGLLMFPWVLMYGITAMLFNHPSWFAASETQPFGPATTEASAFSGLASPEVIASAVVDELNRQELDAGAPPRYRLPADGYIAFGRSGFARTEQEGREHTLVLRSADGSGYVRTRVKDPEAKGLKLPRVNPAIVDDFSRILAEGLHKQLTAIGVDPEGVSFRRLPDVRFDLVVDDEVHRVRYMMPRGSLTVIEPGDTRRFLLQLHMAHGYPKEKTVRWYWAIAVDLMFVTMVFWALSGLLMWWQIRRTRVLGTVCIVVSLVAAAWLAVGMHGALVGPG